MTLQFAILTLSYALSLPGVNPEAAALAEKLQRVNAQTTLIDGCDLSRADELTALTEILIEGRARMWELGFKTDEHGDWVRR